MSPEARDLARRTKAMAVDAAAVETTVAYTTELG